MTGKRMSILLAAAVAAGAAGCGSASDAIDAPDAAQTQKTAARVPKTQEEPSAEEKEEEGDILHIQCWDEEFMQLLENYYPGYEKVDENTGKIGSTTVKFTVTPLDDNEYQDHLDSILPDNSNASAENKVDLFLVEAEDAARYTDAETGYAMRLSDLDIADDALADQYAYTKEAVTDENGNLRGASWQAYSGAMLYNRRVAKKALGLDDPDEVQEAVKDWDAFKKTADAVKAAGYCMTATAKDTYRVYAGNVSSCWTEEGKITVDDHILQWAKDSQELMEKGETTSEELWGEAWDEGIFGKTPVFAYFGPSWLINAILDDEQGLASNPDGFGIVEGPQSFFWGGTWICAAQGTDNPSLVKDIILNMTADEAVLKRIAENESECVNSKKVLNALSEETALENAALGGQNPYGVWASSAAKANAGFLSAYDSICDEEFCGAMESWFDGSKTYEEALEMFEQAVSEACPELTAGG